MKLEIGQCLRENLDEADKELNDIYKRLIGSLQNPAHLRRAQRAWLTVRDGDCRHVSSGEEGSRIGGKWYLACAEEKTRARISELQKYLDQVNSGCSQCPPVKEPERLGIDK